MAFTTDESVLNGINMDLVNQYSQFVNALQPLMLEQSGYQKNTSESNVSSATSAALAKAKQDYEFSQQGWGGNLNAQTQGKDWNQFIQNTVGYMPTNQKQVLAAQSQMEQILKGNLASAQQKYDNEKVSFQQTPEAKALQDQFKSLQQAQLQQMQSQAEYLNSDAFKQSTARQQQLVQAQQEQALSFAQRQKDALDGKIPTSDVLNKQIQDGFNTFKEAQAREGNVIVGDNIDNAVGKGSAAIESLRAFQDNAKASKQRELESIINQTPLGLSSGQAATGLYGASGQINPLSQYTSQGFQQAYGMPQAPNYGSLSQMALAADQPYQFQSQMAMQQQLAAMQQQMQHDASSQAMKSGLLSGGMQLAGMGLGFMAGGPMGAAAGGQLAGGIGALPYGSSPQFGNVGSPVPGMR